MSRVWKLYKEWEKANKQYFKCKLVKESEFEPAKEALMNYLRIQGISLSEINRELETFPVHSELCFYVATFLAGVIVNNLFNKSVTPVHNIITISISALISYLLLFWLRKYVRKISKHMILANTHFLHIVLEEFKDLYKDDIKGGNKLVEIKSGKFANIPLNAEIIYSERMQLSKHYQNVFIIEVKDNNQKFYYVLYLNSDNCSIAKFIRLCKKQTGKNWKNIEKNQITIQKAHTIKKTLPMFLKYDGGSF